MGLYHKANPGDSINNMLSNLPDFLRAAEHLQSATDSEFQVWLEKAISIDKRSTVLYLRQNKSNINSANWRIAQALLPKYLN